MALSSGCGRVSDGRVPEDRGGCGGRGRGRGVGRRLPPPPAGQGGHAVLLAQVPLRTLPGFDLPAQDAFLLHRLHHCGVSAQPGHLQGSKHQPASKAPAPAPAPPGLDRLNTAVAMATGRTFPV